MKFARLDPVGGTSRLEMTVIMLPPRAERFWPCRPLFRIFLSAGSLSVLPLSFKEEALRLENS